MTTITVTIKKEVDAKYLDVSCGVRYWEDAKVNGVEDTDGTLMPCRSGDMWMPLIELETGQILNWEKGKTASVHFKVCDQGMYTLLDAEKNQVKQIDGYVPKIMCPKDSGYGDYIIMDIDEQGMIADWKIDLEKFEDEDE